MTVRVYDPDGDHDEPLRDGDSLRVPWYFADGHRSDREIIADAVRSAGDGGDDGDDGDDDGDGGVRLVDGYGRVLAIVPDRAARDAAAAARQRYIRRTCDAWRKPVSDPPHGSRSAGPGSRPVMPADAAEARRLADEAWRRKVERTSNAWRARR